MAERLAGLDLVVAAASADGASLVAAISRSLPLDIEPWSRPRGLGTRSNARAENFALISPHLFSSAPRRAPTAQGTPPIISKLG